MTANEFGVADYIVFACMLLISSAIGVYHAYGGKQSSTKEYLMAGKGMGCFPIFVSLLASYLSAITLLGVPSEIYTYGVQYCVLILSYFILCTTAAVIYAPVFYRLNLTSAHEVAILHCFVLNKEEVLYQCIFMKGLNGGFVKVLLMFWVAGITIRGNKAMISLNWPLSDWLLITAN